MDGIRALDLWDLVVEVLHASLTQPSIHGNRCWVTLEEIKLIHHCWIWRKFRKCGVGTFYHFGSSACLHSIIQSGLIAEGKETKEGRQTVFFTAVDLMTDFQEKKNTTT